MPLLGAHMSIAGGYDRAVRRAADAGCDVVQVFTKNNNQWRAKPITDQEAEAFQRALAETNVSHPLAHSSYLINLAAADEVLWEKSVESLVVELQRADQLGIPYVVLHPGAHTVLTEEDGLERVVRGLDETHRRTEQLGSRVLLENTAGQGTCLGWRFEQLDWIIRAVDDSERLGVCVDTCHLHAAGYDLTTPTAFADTLDALERTVGSGRVRAIHLNDSKRELGSRVDRHEGIGAGEMGLEPFRQLLNDRRLGDLPMYLETPKGDHPDGGTWDEANLRTLRSMVASKPARQKGQD